MGILPKSYEKVSRFAGIEVLLRGPGDKGQYGYTVGNMLVVAFIVDEKPDATVEDLPDLSDFDEETRQRTQNLLNAYQRHQEYLVKSPVEL